MDDPSQLTAFGQILLIGIVGVLLVLGTMGLGMLISPKNPTVEKRSTYECGEEPQGSPWIQFNSRFYIIALVFLLFDVELIFIFPWATVFGAPELMAADARWGVFTLVEMAIFVGILIVGLVYVWVKGDLEWIKPSPTVPRVSVNIPARAYEHLNEASYTVRPYVPNAERLSETGNSDAVPTNPPAFKPRFKKPGPVS